MKYLICLLALLAFTNSFFLEEDDTFRRIKHDFIARYYRDLTPEEKEIDDVIDYVKNSIHQNLVRQGGFISEDPASNSLII